MYLFQEINANFILAVNHEGLLHKREYVTDA